MSTEPVRVERHDATQVALRAAIEQVNQVVFGKRAQINLGFACLLAGGHLLIEDVPGVGKTTLAHAMATSLGLSYQPRRVTRAGSTIPRISATLSNTSAGDSRPSTSGLA